jgi:hypothetical protein
VEGSFDFTGETAVKTAPTGALRWHERESFAPAPRSVSRSRQSESLDQLARGSGLDREPLNPVSLNLRTTRTAGPC